MSETADTNGAAGAAPVKTEEADHPPPPIKSEDADMDRDDDDAPPDPSQNDHDPLLSHVVPPSHILADGRFIQLPPPTAFEHAAFFERAVAAHGLISVDGEDERGAKNNNKKGTKKRKKDDDADASETEPTAANDGSATTKKRKAASDAPFVHPLAIASARIRAKGVDELSKSINLGGLVMGGEYFGLTNIVNQQRSSTGGAKKEADAAAAAAGGEGKAEGVDVGVGADHHPSGTEEGTAADESILIDNRLRSNYVLRRRRIQNSDASSTLARHATRLSSSVAVMRILDDRLRALRRRWRLVAPEHGTRTVGPVRPREVVAVDVEVYDQDRLGGGNQANVAASSDTVRSSLGRIARRVPRFATMELDDDYDVSVDIRELRKKVKDVLEGLKRKSTEENSEGGAKGAASADHMDVDEKSNKEQQSASGSGGDSASSDPAAEDNGNGVELYKTKAEPFAIADPTLGKIDLDFDPDKVPLLTLLFEIEKPSTGFVERATLSSSFLSSTNSTSENGEKKKSGHSQHPDERVIEALQHSLFCASLFESMRAEIIPAPTPTAVSTTSATRQQRQKQKSSVAWLSSEMEESFLPPPSVMAGDTATANGSGSGSTGDDTRLLCVIHCHEGELKVQLDDEYSLTLKLIEAGTAAAAAATTTTDGVAGVSTMLEKQLSDSSGASVAGASGSQSPAQLQTLCRALLLHSQSLYHEHCMKMRLGNDGSNASSEKKDASKPAALAGFARTKKVAKPPSPHILQSCVSYGCKFIFEKKVRMVLRRLSHWLRNDMSCNDKIYVEWLPLALFDYHSQFVLLFRGKCLDVSIKGDVLRVTQTTEIGGFRDVGFGSELELECYLKMEFRRLLRAGNG